MQIDVKRCEKYLKKIRSIDCLYNFNAFKYQLEIQNFQTIIK